MWLGAGHTAGPAGRPASRTARPGPAACPAGQPASRPASRPTGQPDSGPNRPANAGPPAGGRPAAASSLASRRAVAGEPPPICSLFVLSGKQSSVFLEPPTARGKLRSHTIERSDARICYRTAQPRFRWCKRRRTALRSPETSSSAERKSWDFHRKVGFEWVTHTQRTERQRRPRLHARNSHPVCGLASPPTPMKIY